MSLDFFKTTCKDTFNSYKEPYITNYIKDVDSTLDQFEKDVFIIYNKKFETNFSLNDKLEFAVILGKYRKKLKVFYSSL